jgi:hypothetical protein
MTEFPLAIIADIHGNRWALEDFYDPCKDRGRQEKF